MEIIRAGGAANGVLHADDRTLVIEEDDVFTGGALPLQGFGGGFCQQAASVVVVKLLAVGD